MTVLAVIGWSAACGGDDGEDSVDLPCVADLPATCAPAFTPTWTNVYANVVRQSCGGVGSGTSCHAPEGKQGGLELSSSDISYASLLGELDGRPRVLPGDPACSILMERLETDDEELRMPGGESQPLSAATRCAVQQWIEQGAEK
jgi:Planctomycete cytochrome C